MQAMVGPLPSFGFLAHRWFWPLWLQGIVLAAWLTEEAWEHPAFPGDVHLALEVQAHHWKLVGALFAVPNLLGSGPVSLALAGGLVLLFLGLRRFDLALVMGATLPLRLVGGLLKGLAERPRPSEALVRVTEQASGASFPSGHVFNAVLVFGALTLVLEAVPLRPVVRRSLQVGCLAVVLLVGPARVYVGAHWPSDTLGGYLWGTLLLALVLRGAWTFGWRPIARP